MPIACNSLSYTLFDSVLLCLYLCVSFDLLEVCVLNIVRVVGLLTTSLLSAVEACAGTWLCSASLSVHLCACCLHNLVEVVDGGVDGGDVGSLVGILELLEC